MSQSEVNTEAEGRLAHWEKASEEPSSGIWWLMSAKGERIRQPNISPAFVNPAIETIIRASERASLQEQIRKLQDGVVVARAALTKHRDYCEHERYVGSADVIQEDIEATDRALGRDTEDDYYDSDDNPDPTHTGALPQPVPDGEEANG